MTPSVEARIASMIGAMKEAILPALDPGDPLAREQAELMIGQLHLLAVQADHVDRVEAIELRAARILAQGLVAAAGGGPLTLRAADELNKLIGSTGGELHGADRRARTEALNARVDTLIEAASADGEADFMHRMRRLVLDVARASSLLNRSCFALTRFERASVALPSIEDAMRIFAAELGRLEATERHTMARELHDQA